MLTTQMLYSALYQKPLYDMINTEGENKRLNICIFGGGQEAMLCFKTAFWCGQLSFSDYNYRLNIKVITDDPEETKAEYLKAMPALLQYELADISFIKKESSFYGDIAAKEKICIFDFTEEAPDTAAFSEGAARIYTRESKADLFDEKAEIISVDETDTTELMELAFGVHFNYKRAFDAYADKRAERTAFFAEGNEYNRNSSLASALHIRYKLYSGGVDWFSVDNAEAMAAALRAISEIIDKKGDTYNQLINLEHSRWMAYMISQGFTAPTDEELEQYAFNYYDYNGKRGFIDSFKNNVYPPFKHPCIVPAENGIVLGEMSKRQWERLTKSDIERMDPLDRVSVKLHELAVKKAQEYRGRIFSLLDEISGDDTLYKELADLKIIVDMLYNENLRAEQLWEKYLGQIKKKLPEGSKITEKINTLNQFIQAVKERNRYCDYKQVDSNFIDMLPYIIYSVKPYSTLIKFYSSDIISNVASAATLIPERVVFWGIDTSDKDILDTAKEFLQKRNIINESSHENKEVVFYFCKDSSADIICCKFYDFIEKYGIKPEDCVIDVTDANTNFCTAAGVISAKSNIPLIKFDYKDGVKGVMNEGKLCFTTNIPKVSIDELYALLNCRELFRLSHSDALSLKSNIRSLYEIFCEYKNVWTTAIDEIRKFRTDSVLFEKTPDYVKDNKDNPISRFSRIIPAAAFNGKDLSNFLSNLEFLGIIDKLRIRAYEEKGYEVEFDYYDKVVADIITDDKENAPVVVRFCGNSMKFVQHSLVVKDMQIPNNILPIAIEVLKKAEGRRLIKNLRIYKKDGGEYISYEYVDDIAKKCLTTDGAVLELFVYYTAFESNYFHDVKNNFHFLWKNAEGSMNVTEKDRKFTGISRFNFMIYRSSTEQVKNEIDVIVAKDFRLKLISCKSGKVKQLDLMQIKYLTECFGKYGNAILAYSNDGSKPGGTATTDSIRSRAKEMKIDCIPPDIIFSKKAALIESMKRDI